MIWFAVKLYFHCLTKWHRMAFAEFETADKGRSGLYFCASCNPKSSAQFAGEISDAKAGEK